MSLRRSSRCALDFFKIKYKLQVLGNFISYFPVIFFVLQPVFGFIYEPATVMCVEKYIYVEVDLCRCSPETDINIPLPYNGMLIFI